MRPLDGAAIAATCLNRHTSDLVMYHNKPMCKLVLNFFLFITNLLFCDCGSVVVPYHQFSTTLTIKF